MTDTVRNILFIMFDQLRFDYLSCYGHPHLATAHIDALAQRGVRFTRCYAQSTICGPSRMSSYTGRYVSSHGSTWNNIPLSVGEPTLGDHLRELGVQSWLVGKTHMAADLAGMNRLGITTDTVAGARVAECGFDVFVREDGLWAEGPEGFYDNRRSPYNEYLQNRGYPGDNPWHEFANSGIDADDQIASGWLMENAVLPANIREEDSETPYLTGKGIEFIERMSASHSPPWLCHLSYIKPHWPYIVPAPYHQLYDRRHILPVVREPSEIDTAHPLFRAFMDLQPSRAFQRESVREAVIPAYMGLVKQCDDQLGRLFSYLEKSGRMDDTMIVVTSDHGDYLGDHYLGEKNLFHEPSVRVPLIIYDPRRAADSTRGSVCDKLVEAIDLPATFIEAAGGEIPRHIVEGRSLQPLLHGERVADWREYVVSEYDYAPTPVCAKLGVDPMQTQMFMVADQRWKFIHADGGFRPMLFDLENDPNELIDLATRESVTPVLDIMYQRLGVWSRRLSQRTTRAPQAIAKRRGASRRKGILLGLVDGSEIDAELLQAYRGHSSKRYLDEKR